MFPGFLKVANDCALFCFGEAFIKATDRPAETFDCLPHGLLVELSGYPHWLVGHRSIGATAGPNYKQNEKDTMGCLQGHRRETATVRTKAPRAIFGRLTGALSNLALDLHRAP